MGNGKKLSVEVHKFGGASLADGAAFRHAVDIVAGRRGPAVVVVSAPAGVTDLLLGMATRARGGEDAELDREVQALRQTLPRHPAAPPPGAARRGRRRD